MQLFFKLQSYYNSMLLFMHVITYTNEQPIVGIFTETLSLINNNCICTCHNHDKLEELNKQPV